jgi:hypothetical protein
MGKPVKNTPKNLDGQTKKSKTISNSMPKCQYCGTEFKRETTLISHLCEEKRRIKQKDHYGVRLGFNAWLRFYEKNNFRQKESSYEAFCNNPYYTTFVKFGNFLESVNCFDPKNAIEWYLDSNIKIDVWTTDKSYDKWITDYIKNETADSGLERTINFTEKWANENDSMFNHYFKYETKKKICYAINAGKISPWILFNCQTGITLLESFDENDLISIMHLIDPEHWQGKFKRNESDVEFVKETLIAAGF